MSATSAVSTAHTIIICMGSSCYLRGNQRNTEIIQDFIKAEGLDASVEFSGALCSEHCKEGPVITIDGKTYTRVANSGLEPLLSHIFREGAS